jgi:hypothetical protein
MAIKRWNASTSQWELVGTPGTATPSAIGAAALSGNNTFSGSQTVNFSSGTNVNTGINFNFTGAGGSDFKIVRNSTANTQTVRTFRIRGGNDFDSFTSFELGMESNHPLRFVTNDTERMRIESNGSIGIGSANTSTFNPDSAYNKVLVLQQTDQALTFGSYWQAGVGQSSFINSSQGSSRANASNLFLQTGGLNRLLIETNGNVQMPNNGVDSLRYFDIYNTHTGTSAGTIIRLITNNAANSAVTTVDMVKYRNGTFLIANNDTGATAIFQFNNAGSERMRIDGNGSLLVGYTGTNSASYKLQVNSQIFATSSSIATSDGRYKENVLPITSGLDIIDSLNPVSFDWKEHPVHNFVPGKTVGFIAQEVQEALSDYEWVDNIIKTNTTESVLDEEGNEITPSEEFLGIAESNIIPLLVAAVKELRAEVNTLKAQLSN